MLSIRFIHNKVKAYFINFHDYGKTARHGGNVSEGKDNGRPPLEDEKQTGYTVAMTPTLIEALKGYAQEAHMSPSAVVREAVKDKLRNVGHWDDTGNGAA